MSLWQRKEREAQVRLVSAHAQVSIARDEQEQPRALEDSDP
jgi:hypothetical protein